MASSSGEFSLPIIFEIYVVPVLINPLLKLLILLASSTTELGKLFQAQIISGHLEIPQYI